MIGLRVVGGSIEAGVSYLDDACLIWNAFDRGATTLDVVLYLHGFAVSGGAAAPLSDFVAVSGLASSVYGLAQVRRSPTVAIIPRGQPAASAAPGKPWPFYFPSVVQDQGVANLIQWALRSLASARAEANPAAHANLTLGRLILSADSGACARLV